MWREDSLGWVNGSCNQNGLAPRFGFSRTAQEVAVGRGKKKLAKITSPILSTDRSILSGTLLRGYCHLRKQTLDPTCVLNQCSLYPQLLFHFKGERATIVHLVECQFTPDCPYVISKHKKGLYCPQRKFQSQKFTFKRTKTSLLSRIQRHVGIFNVTLNKPSIADQ